MSSLRTTAQELHDRAVAQMANLGVPLTAENYMIWYHDAANDCPELSQTLRQMVARGEPFTEQVCAQLYERSFGSDQQANAVETTCFKLEETMDRIMLEISAASDGSNDYGDALSGFQDRLKQSPALREIRNLIEDVLQKTEQMQESTIGLRSALAASTQEIALLREDLAVKCRQAETDSLTGVANRRKLEAEYEAAARIADTTRAPLSLLIVDIDRFKSFNDTYGHQIGDQVLKAMARVLIRCVKGGDLVARYGGEEFAIILPNTDLTGAIAVGNQIREAIARNCIRLKLTGETLRSITLSGGGAQHAPGDRFADIVARADAALRQSKQAGRNQIRSFDGTASRAESPTAA